MSPRRRAHAFTLIEAIIAIVVISIAIPPMLLAVREAQRQRVGPVQVDRARWLAAERLEQVIADRHSSVRGWTFVAGGNYPPEPQVSGFPGFSRITQITETGASLAGSGTGFKTVRVTVSWTDAGGARSFELATVLTEYGS